MAFNYKYQKIHSPVMNMITSTKKSINYDENYTKSRVAFFDSASCEGCQLQIANLEEEILDVVARVDIK